jgi:hypothetical protein
VTGNGHARFWIGGGGSNPVADHTQSRMAIKSSTTSRIENISPIGWESPCPRTSHVRTLYCCAITGT